MKQIGEKTYYSKAEIQQMIGCSIATINARICAAKISGYYLGHAKYYDEEQVKQIAEYRKNPEIL